MPSITPKPPTAWHSIEPTAKRVAASAALKDYGDLLTQLVSDDRTANLQKSANSLLNNTTAALGHDLSDDKKDALTKVIAGFGSLWVEKKKAESVKEIVLAYQQPVADLADMLSEDFSIDDNSLGYLKAYEITAKRLKNASMRLVNAGDKYTILERDRAVNAYAISEMALTRSNELSSKAKQSIDGLKAANAELAKVLSKQHYDTDDIKNYTKKIQDLVNMYKVLSK